MTECQICNVKKGKHKVEPQGLCGDHAEKIEKMLNWWGKNVEKKKEEKKINFDLT